MTIEKIVKTTFMFQLNNNLSSFNLDEDEVKQIIHCNEALTVSDSSGSSKKYVVVKKDAFKKRWLLPTLENLFRDGDFVKEHLAEIIKDIAGFFCSDSSEDFINSDCGNKKFLEAFVEKLFNFNSDDEDIRSEAISRVKKYFGLNFIEEFTFVDDQNHQHQLLVFEVLQWR